MNFFDLTEDQRREMCLDYDLACALKYNPQSFNLLDIKRLLAVVEGERDGPKWHWIIKLRDGRVAYMSGGCDYTGWDCQSNASSEVFPTTSAAIKAAPTDDRRHGDVRAKLKAQVSKGLRARTKGDKLSELIGDLREVDLS